MLLLPGGTVYVLRELLHVSLSKQFLCKFRFLTCVATSILMHVCRTLVVHVYPGIFAVVGLSRVVVSAMIVLSSWSQSVRDKEFLVEMQLQNFESEKSEQKTNENKTELGIVGAERAIVEER